MHSVKIAFLAAILAFIFIGCETPRDAFLKDYNKGCAVVLKNKEDLAYCECIGEYVADRFTSRELDYIKRFETEVPWSMDEMYLRQDLRERLRALNAFVTNPDKHTPAFKAKIKACLEKKSAK